MVISHEHFVSEILVARMPNKAPFSMSRKSNIGLKRGSEFCGSGLTLLRERNMQYWKIWWRQTTLARPDSSVG